MGSAGCGGYAGKFPTLAGTDMTCSASLPSRNVLLREDEARSRTFGQELDRRERDGEFAIVEVHVVGVNDAAVRHDVVIERIEDVIFAVRAKPFDPPRRRRKSVAAHLFPVIASGEPAGLRLLLVKAL